MKVPHCAFCERIVVLKADCHYVIGQLIVHARCRDAFLRIKPAEKKKAVEHIQLELFNVNDVDTGLKS